jgi:hypothetical protein
MIAHTGFQLGAKNEAKKHCIVLSDSRDLAEILSLSRRFYPSVNASNRVSRLLPDTRSLLAQYSD